MLRRHASWLRALLMLTDGILAAVTVALTSVVRFGEDWSIHWDPLVPDTTALTLLYCGRSGCCCSP